MFTRACAPPLAFHDDVSVNTTNEPTTHNRQPSLFDACPRQRLASLFHDLYATLAFRLVSFAPCVVCGIRARISLPGEEFVEVGFRAGVRMLELGLRGYAASRGSCGGCSLPRTREDPNLDRSRSRCRNCDCP